MPIHNLILTTTFRQAIGFMLAFSGISALALGLFYSVTISYLDKQVSQQLERESGALIRQIDQTGESTTLAQLMEGQAYSEKGLLFALLDSDNTLISGNISDLSALPMNGSEFDFVQFIDSEQAYLRGTWVTLPTDHKLLIATRIDDIEALIDFSGKLLASTLAFVLIIGLGGGLMLSRNLTRRIDTINRTSRQIIRGDLTRRIPRPKQSDEITQLIDNLNEMLDQIEHLVQGVRRVSDNIAHDLRTPLTRLKQQLEQLGRCSEGKGAELSQQCVEEADQMLATFSALLRIAQLENRGRDLRFSRVELGQIVHDVAELYEPLAQQKHQTIAVINEQGQPLSLDRDLIFQALANLLDNSVKYSPPGGKIEIGCSREGNKGRLWVKDEGPGIAPAEHEKVMQRFYRGEPARNTPGNGLGLSLVDAIVRLHDGAVIIRDCRPGLRVLIEIPNADWQPSSTQVGKT